MRAAIPADTPAGEYRGNPWRGMLFGMTGRLGHGADRRPLWSEWDAFGIDRARMLGWWSPANPARTGRADVPATAYLRTTPDGAGSALVAVASWAPEPLEVALSFDPAVLPAGPAHATAIDGFQPRRSFEPGEPLLVPPGRGWLLRVGWRTERRPVGAFVVVHPVLAVLFCRLVSAAAASGGPRGRPEWPSARLLKILCPSGA